MSDKPARYEGITLAAIQEMLGWLAACEQAPRVVLPAPVRLHEPTPYQRGVLDRYQDVRRSKGKRPRRR